MEGPEHERAIGLARVPDGETGSAWDLAREIRELSFDIDMIEKEELKLMGISLAFGELSGCEDYTDARFHLVETIKDVQSVAVRVYAMARAIATRSAE